MKMRTLIVKLQVVRAVLACIKDYILSFMMKAELNREEFGYYSVIPINIRLSWVTWLVDKVLGYSHKLHKWWLGDRSLGLIMFPPSQWAVGERLNQELKQFNALKKMWYHRRKLLR